jgi:hypothetical protein
VKPSAHADHCIVTRYGVAAKERDATTPEQREGRAARLARRKHLAAQSNLPEQAREVSVSKVMKKQISERNVRFSRGFESVQHIAPQRSDRTIQRSKVSAHRWRQTGIAIHDHKFARLPAKRSRQTKCEGAVAATEVQDSPRFREEAQWSRENPGVIHKGVEPPQVRTGMNRARFFRRQFIQPLRFDDPFHSMHL